MPGTPTETERHTAAGFTVHTTDTAPPAAQTDIAEIQAKYGRVPNMLGAMAGAPALLKSYRVLREAFEETSFTAVERNVVLLAVSYENDCRYCMAAHSILARMQDVPGDIVSALRDGTALSDVRLEALRRFTQSVVTGRGTPDTASHDVFFAAGFTPANALEVVLGVGLKTLSNYTNHLVKPTLDEGYASASWSKPE